MIKGKQIGMVFFEASNLWLPVRSEADQKLTEDLKIKIINTITAVQADFGEYYIYISRNGSISKNPI